MVAVLGCQNLLTGYPSAMEELTKEEWIQKAKALLFDCTFCVDSESIKSEIEDLLKEGGGYDPMEESFKTMLRWKKS